MANRYGVVRLDLMDGTDVGAQLCSLRYQVSGKDTEIQNGSVVKLGNLLAGEREVYAATDVAANDKLKDVVLVASPEVMYDERKKNLDEFINEAGDDARGYRFHMHNVFSVTAEALTYATKSGAPDIEVGYAVELAAGNKLKVASSATASSTQVGKIIAIDIVGRYTYYVIRVTE